MKFKEALSAIELVMITGEVPLLIGESGIGKTSLIKNISKKNNYNLVTIDGNLLKEGEIGGLPIVENKEYLLKNGEILIKKVTNYATHSKLVEIDEILKEKQNKVLLFVDELNRCEHAVQQELMNLILNREINGYKLSENVYIVAAMNPSSKYDDFENSDYQVVDMDPAQEDRFVWIELESDLNDWISWAMGDGKINDVIIEFLSTFPEYLHTPYGKENIKATPRSWERISKAYSVFEKNKGEFSENILYNVVKGNVGVAISQDFMSFLKNIKEPILKPEQIFKDDVLSFDIKDIIEKENHSRLYIMAKNALNYLENNILEKNIIVFSEMIKCYPKDLRLGIMKEIKASCSKELYSTFLDNDMFLDAFFDIYC